MSLFTLVCRLRPQTRLIQIMENPTNNNQPADQEEVKQENTQAAAAEGEERKIGDAEEVKTGEGKLLSK